ncbi:MAG: NAD(P)-dependent oxidoreductase [Fimbriimonadaceae bacterium]
MRVGVLGLGAMGSRMAARLAAAGHDVCGYDPHPNSAASEIELMTDEIETVRRAETVLLSLPNQNVQADVVEKILGAVAGRTIVDTTTTTPTRAMDTARRLSEHGAEFLDAPVTGGTGGAENGTLTVMVGGEQAVLESQMPALSAMGSRIVHIGPHGHGQIAKMVNQLLMAAIYASVGESFALASRWGADISRVYEAVEYGGGQSFLLSAMKADMLAGRIQTEGNLAQHGKDVEYALTEAQRSRAYVPISSAVQQLFRLACVLGLDRAAAGNLWAVWHKLEE